VFNSFYSLFRRMIANHVFGPPGENDVPLSRGFTSNWDGSIDSIAKPLAKASRNSCRDTRRGPSVPGSSSLKHARKSHPPGASTVRSPST
jgi:hypothetical protein